MPRRSGGSRSSARPAARQSSTVAAPVSKAQSPPAPAPPANAQSGTRQPGMIAQMAATAGSVAVGSTIGHGLSNMLFGGRSSEAEPAANTAQRAGGSCEFQAKEFTKCLDAADVQTCTWFLDQLKACQAAASQY